MAKTKVCMMIEKSTLATLLGGAVKGTRKTATKKKTTKRKTAKKR